MWSPTMSRRFSCRPKPGSTIRILIGGRWTCWHPSPTGGRKTLADLRSLLGALDGKAENTRAPAEQQAAEVIARAQAAGQRGEICGARPALPAHRRYGLVSGSGSQEGLTNALKYAREGAATVAISYGKREIMIEVASSGRSAKGSASKSGGRGIIGMRERVGTSEQGFPTMTTTPTNTPIRVLICDDQELVRTGFSTIINAQPDLVVVGEAADGEEAVRVTRRERPDVVVMDIRMPLLDGIEATRRIAGPQASDAARVLVVTTFSLDGLVYDALRAGASGFLLKDARPAQLAAAIRTIAAGDSLIAPELTRSLIGRFGDRLRPSAKDSAIFDALTAREREVLRLIAEGLSNAEIAAVTWSSATRR